MLFSQLASEMSLVVVGWWYELTTIDLANYNLLLQQEDEEAWSSQT